MKEVKFWTDFEWTEKIIVVWFLSIIIDQVFGLGFYHFSSGIEYPE